MATEPRDAQDRPPRGRRRAWLLRGSIVLATVLVVAGLGALALWTYRTVVLEQLARWYLKGDGITEVTLQVEQAERDFLLVRDLRIVGRTTVSIDTLQFDYRLDRLLDATIRRVDVQGISIEGLGAPAEIERIEGVGEVVVQRARLQSLLMGLDVLHLRIDNQSFEPGRIDVAYYGGDLTLDGALVTQGGQLALVGHGPIADPQHPFRVNLSGFISTALLAPFLPPHIQADGMVDLSLAGEIGEPLTLFSNDSASAAARPVRMSVEGELGLRLASLSVDGVAWPTSKEDRIGFMTTDMTIGPGAANGGFEFDAMLGRRETEDFGFTNAQIILAGIFDLAGTQLRLDLTEGPLLRVSSARLRQGLPLSGDMSLRLRGEDNRLSVDLARGAASHRIAAALEWPEGTVTLNSAGHMTDRGEPTVFTVRGAFDATPLLALLPATAKATGQANIFLAGRVSQPMLFLGQGVEKLAEGDGWPGDLRFDGAFKLETEGTRVPHLTAPGAPKDSIEIALKSFDGSRSYQTGRVSVTAALDRRSIGGTTIDGAKLSLHGRFTADQRGYRFEPFFESTLALGRIDAAGGFAIPDGVTFQLFGTENHLTASHDFTEIRHELTFAHLEARGGFENGEPRRMRIVVPKLVSQDTANGERRIQLSDGRLDLADGQLNVIGIGAAAEFDAENVGFSFDAHTVRHAAKPPLTTPLSLAGKGRIAGDLLTATLKAQQIFSPLALHAKLRHQLSTNTGRVDFSVPTVRLDPEKKTVVDVFPSAAPWVDSAGGTAALEGHLLWDRDVASGQMTLSLKDGSLQTRDIRLSGVSGNINFVELLPLTTPPRQRIDATLTAPKLGPLPTWIEFQLRDDSTVDIQELEVQIAGGTLLTKGLLQPGEAFSLDADVGVNAVNVATLFEIIGVDGLSGTGQISGRIPLRYTSEGLAISKGSLQALEAGRLRYEGTRLQEMLAERQDTVAMVVKVLSDFHYDTLSMELEKETGGHGHIMLRMNGRNPAVYDGHPFIFNVRIESDFDKLGRLALGGTQAVIDAMRRAGAQEPQE